MAYGYRMIWSIKTMKSAKQLFAAAVTPIALTLVLSPGVAFAAGSRIEPASQDNITGITQVLIDTPEIGRAHV